MTSITKELKQKKPFPSKTQEAGVALLRTADLVRRSFALVLEPYDITVQQYNVLRILRGTGEKGLPTLDIATRMIEETPGITRLIDRLETKQLVRRVRCETDRRQVFCHITQAGLDLLESLEPAVVAVGEGAFAGLRLKDLEELLMLLDRTRDGLHVCIAHQRAINDETVSRRRSGGTNRSTRQEKS